MFTTSPRLFRVTCLLGTVTHAMIIRADSKEQAISEFRYLLLAQEFDNHPNWNKAKFRAELQKSA